MNDEKNSFPYAGMVQWIGVRPSRGEPVEARTVVSVDLDLGLVDDHFSGKAGSPRQVTLIQQEHLDVLAKLLRMQSVDPALTRRNILVSGINLAALKEKIIQIGSAKLKVTGGCPPCGRMESNLGAGGYNAMMGHGGVTASVVQPGTIQIGDRVQPIFDDSNLA
jgi:MOSC domain-containing protein YiiM